MITNYLNIKIMATNNSSKFKTYLYIALTILGCILACSSIIPNVYLKLGVVMASLIIGIYGISKSLSKSESKESSESK